MICIIDETHEILYGPADFTASVRQIVFNLGGTGTVPDSEPLDIVDCEPLRLCPVYDPLDNDESEFYRVSPGAWFFDEENGYVTRSLNHTHRTLDEVATLQREKLAAIRWRKQSAGVSVSEVQLRTEPEDVAALSAYAQILPDDETLDWKSNGQFVSLTKSALTAVMTAIDLHIRCCFSAEKQVCTTISAISEFDALVTLDLSALFDAAYTALSQSE